MNYKKLGNTDINVSTICLGTMTWGEQNTQSEAFEQMNYSLENGVNFWDTAELYAVPPKAETYGHTETIIGNWFEETKKRKDIILASKVGGPSRKYIRNGENSFTGKNLEDALHGSLKRLKTDYIDLYQLHWPERNVNNFGKLGYEHKENDWNKFEDVLENLKKFIEQGKIRYVGLSNETPWGVMNYLQLAKDKGLPRMMAIQNPYSLLNRSYEVGLAEVSIRENMENAVEDYYKISQKYDLDMSQMSIKFCEVQDFMTSVIIGATTMEQLKTNVESVKVNLDSEVIKEINNVQKKYPNPCP